MAGRLQRKLVDVTTGEQLAAIKEALEAKKIPVHFQILTRSEADTYRVFVYVMHLESAKKVLEESRKK